MLRLYRSPGTQPEKLQTHHLTRRFRGQLEWTTPGRRAATPGMPKPDPALR
jgi:hypothetical protein